MPMMINSERAYYVAAGESLKAVEKMAINRAQCNSKRSQLAGRFNASSLAVTREDVVGHGPPSWAIVTSTV